MEQFRQTLLDLALGRREITATELAEAGVEAGLSSCILVRTSLNPVEEVLQVLLNTTTTIIPEPFGGAFYYRVRHEGIDDFIYADKWWEAVVAIRFSKMAVIAPTLKLLYEAVQELDEEERNLLLGAPTTDRFPLTTLLKCSSSTGTTSFSGFTSTDGDRSVLSLRLPELYYLVLSPAFRREWNRAEGILYLRSQGIMHEIHYLHVLPPIMLAAQAWRDLHMPE